MFQDVADLRAVLETRLDGIDWAYLGTWLPERELRLLEEITSVPDDELLQRLLSPRND